MTGNTHSTTSPELLPCPFCGNHGVGPAFICESGRWDFWQVECEFCDYAIETPTGFAGDAAKDAAVERWNTRSQPQSPSTSLSDAYHEALRRYPDAHGALVFFWTAAGLGAEEPTAEQIEWATTVMKSKEQSNAGQ